jgi:hypothetical protein
MDKIDKNDLMDGKYVIVIHTFESHDAEKLYQWEIEHACGYRLERGLAETPLLCFANAMAVCEKLKNR